MRNRTKLLEPEEAETETEEEEEEEGMKGKWVLLEIQEDKAARRPHSPDGDEWAAGQVPVISTICHNSVENRKITFWFVYVLNLKWFSADRVNKITWNLFFNQ